MILSTCHVENPMKSALLFSAVLAADKGVPSEVIEDGSSVEVLADDGRSILFSPIEAAMDVLDKALASFAA